MHLQYGCGWTAPKSWCNFDASPTLRFERIPVIGRVYTKNSERFPANVRYGDVTKGLPVSDASCDGVFCSHVLEHLALDGFHRALQETWRVLRPGGKFRLVVPDLEFFARQYITALSRGDKDANSDFMTGTCLGIKARSKGPGALLRLWLGNSSHLWMWDFPSIQAELTDVGFEQIRRAAFNDSEDPLFKQVEEEARFQQALAVEATKPRA